MEESLPGRLAAAAELLEDAAPLEAAGTPPLDPLLAALRCPSPLAEGTRSSNKNKPSRTLNLRGKHKLT